MLIRCFLFLIILLNCSQGFGQSYSFISYSIAEGLPQSQVSAITEDENGYLWVGTLGGLGRFNGATFVNFSTRDGLLNNRITSLNNIDKQLWVGHEGGVSLLSNGKIIKKWAFDEENKTAKVLSIQYFNGNHVIATNGGGLFLIDKEQKIKNLRLKTSDEDRVRGMAIANGELYIASRAGLLKTANLIHFEYVKGAENLNISGITLSNKELIFTTFDRKFKDSDAEPTIPGEFYSLDLKTNIIKKLGNVSLNMAIRNCIVDSQTNNIWAPSHQGIVVLNRNGDIRTIDQAKGLPLNALSTIYEDRNGTIWIGSEGKGLFRFPGEQFRYYKKDENSKTGIKSDLTVSALQVNSNRYLFGTYDNKGIIELLNNNLFYLNPVTTDIIWALEKDNAGNVWIGTDVGLLKYSADKIVESFYEIHGTPGEKITALFKDGNEIWIGGSNGLAKIVNGQIIRIQSSEKNPEIGQIRNIVKFKNKIFCAADGGLFTFINGKFNRINGIPKKTVSLETDPFGNLWIGTEEGFYWSDGKTYQQIYLSDQPASGFINFIRLNLAKDKLFVGTNNGLYVLADLQHKYKAKNKHYGLEEGLVSLESNINSEFVDNKGRLWFGTTQGLTVFDPAAEIFDTGKNKPFLNIKSLKLNFQDFKYTDYATKFNAYGKPLNLVLPRSKNNLLIELDGVTLKNSKELRFQYWLEGLDEDWSPPFSNPQVTLSNLPAGQYDLHVRAIDGNGKFSNEYVLNLEIAPAFYATWWFFLLMFILAIGMVILIIQIRVRSERAKSYQETLEYKARLSSLEQQSLNASMNRHFIFNSLNSIQYFINTQDRVSANRYLTSFAKLIRKNLDSSSEDNNMVSLSQEIERLELYLSLESMRFRDRFDYKIEVSDIDIESIMVPAMLFQPFVENSIIHGILPVEDKKGLISIKIVAKGDYLEVILEDNGVGIERSIHKKSKNDGDHKSQGMEITSKRIELLKKLSNKNFEMEGPFQIEDENHTINGTRVLLKIPCENLEDQD